MLAATEALSTQIPVTRACDALAFPRSSLYRSRRPALQKEAATRPTPARALPPGEKETVRDLLNSERFCDRSPYQMYATLLDEGHYYCSISTMYRILREHDEVRERRDQKRHPSYSKPELLATAPNQLWSWDGRPLGRLVNVSSDTAHHQGCASSPWRSKEPSNLGPVSFQGTRASRAKEADFQYANVQEWMDRG
jgi:hypothetical protein